MIESEKATGDMQWRGVNLGNKASVSEDQSINSAMF